LTLFANKVTLPRFDHLWALCSWGTLIHLRSLWAWSVIPRKRRRPGVHSVPLVEVEIRLCGTLIELCRIIPVHTVFLGRCGGGEVEIHTLTHR
jgi:hypothetical protein